MIRYAGTKEQNRIILWDQTRPDRTLFYDRFESIRKIYRNLVHRSIWRRMRYVLYRANTNKNTVISFLHSDTVYSTPRITELPCRGIVHDPELETSYGTVPYIGHLIRFDSIRFDSIRFYRTRNHRNHGKKTREIDSTFNKTTTHTDWYRWIIRLHCKCPTRWYVEIELETQEEAAAQTGVSRR